MRSFYWYDLETSGRDARWQRIVQFAGQRTTPDLEPVGEALVHRVKLDADVLPEPEACSVTGLTPQRCAQGLDEPELLRQLQAQWLDQPGTCVAGYNSLRFDDEFVRFSLYRNLFDPYEREWRGGNSRWDLIDLARMAGALRPEGLEWPDDGAGRPSFRLEALSAVNGIEHTHAHDALGDVRATIELARSLKRAQPRLFAWYCSLRDRRRARALLSPLLAEPVLHVSGRYAQARHCLGVVTAVAPHPWYANAVLVADLTRSPETLETLPAEGLRERLFSPARGTCATPPLKEVRLNRCPALAPLSVLRERDIRRLGLDLERCRGHLERLRRTPGLGERVAAAFASRPAPAVDVDAALYDGFFDDADRARLAGLREAAPDALAGATGFGDSRAAALVARYRARRHPQSLGEHETRRWQAEVRSRLERGTDGAPSLAAFRQRVEALAARGADETVLSELRDWGARLETAYNVGVAEEG